MRGLVATAAVGRGLVAVPPRLRVPRPSRRQRGAGAAGAAAVGRVAAATARAGEPAVARAPGEG